MTQVVELYVVMYCDACATSVKRAVKKIPGVESYKIDYYGQKVTVVGNVDRDDVWRRIHKTGRQVMLIADPAPPKEEPKKEQKKEEKKVETKSEEKTKVKVKEQKTEETKIVGTQGEKKVEQVVTVVETKKEEKKQEEPKVEKKGETKAEVKKEEAKKKEPERPKEPEWVPMFVTAPYYTLPNRFYNY